MIIVSTNGKPTRADGRPVGPGGISPIDVALANLRRDCEADRRDLMARFRWHVEKRTDVFGLREATRVAQANEARARWDAWRAEHAEKVKTAEPKGAPALPGLSVEEKRDKVMRAAALL